MIDKTIDKYESLKHDFRISYLKSEQSVGMFHLNDLGPQFDDCPLFALKVSLALATIEAELFLMLFYFLYCCVEIFSGTMRGCGESIKPMILVCLGICVLRIAWLTFISPHYPTIKGVVVSYPVTWFTTSVLFIIYYKHFKKHHFDA